MQQLASFLSGTWQSGRGRSRLIHHAISGEALWEVTSEGLDMAAGRRGSWFDDGWHSAQPRWCQLFQHSPAGEVKGVNMHCHA